MNKKIISVELQGIDEENLEFLIDDIKIDITNRKTIELDSSKHKFEIINEGNLNKLWFKLLYPFICILSFFNGYDYDNGFVYSKIEGNLRANNNSKLILKLINGKIDLKSYEFLEFEIEKKDYKNLKKIDIIILTTIFIFTNVVFAEIIFNSEMFFKVLFAVCILLNLSCYIYAVRKIKKDIL